MTWDKLTDPTLNTQNHICKTMEANDNKANGHKS